MTKYSKEFHVLLSYLKALSLKELHQLVQFSIVLCSDLSLEVRWDLKQNVRWFCMNGLFILFAITLRTDFLPGGEKNLV